MAMLGIFGWFIIGLYMLPMVKGGYNCSKSHILEEKADDFRETLKHASSNLKVYLFSQKDMKMNLSSKSEKTGLFVWVWGECDKDQGSDVCRVSKHYIAVQCLLKYLFQSSFVGKCLM